VDSHRPHPWVLHHASKRRVMRCRPRSGLRGQGPMSTKSKSAGKPGGTLFPMCCKAGIAFQFPTSIMTAVEPRPPARRRPTPNRADAAGVRNFCACLAFVRKGRTRGHRRNSPPQPEDGGEILRYLSKPKLGVILSRTIESSLWRLGPGNVGRAPGAPSKEDASGP